MKKTFTIVALAAALCACHKPAPQLNSNNYGYIDLGIATEEVTKASVDNGNLSSWHVTVTKSGESSPAFSDTADKLSSHAFLEGSYAVKAYNYADDASAFTANEGWGAARYEGTTESNITVSAGQSETATINCGKAKNARLKVVFHESFTNIAKDYKLTATQGERSLVFSTNDKVAYYTAGTAVNYVINYKMKSNDSEKTIDNKSFTLTAGQEKTITLKGNTNGTITISISYDDTFNTGVDEEITIDGATGGVATK